MTNILHRGETRSQTVLRHTQEAISAGAMRVLPFSERVAERYLQDVPPQHRTVSLREPGVAIESALAANKHNGQVIDRLVRGVVKSFPADLEDAWVACLPMPHRERCEQDLESRRGHVPVRDPRASDAPAQQGGELCDLLREVGESAAALAPIFADGRVDAADLPYIGPALQQLGELLAAGLQVHHRLTKVVIDSQRPTNVLPLQRA
ncbi:hypothetical protein [Lysobacter sp. Root96]|uniref:hypothetical protein n=1 Tax=Lysobacter sp. Root96 TaxID=1736612 RepID=UPI0006FED89D|nr:hypothetical protein [Lysobacter sp. Root96]KRD71417.1 hypothetical protein ASE45_06295 [Lysobacter sp. Root96]